MKIKKIKIKLSDLDHVTQEESKIGAIKKDGRSWHFEPDPSWVLTASRLQRIGRLVEALNECDFGN